jgi:hypothetical protein
VEVLQFVKVGSLRLGIKVPQIASSYAMI